MKLNKTTSFIAIGIIIIAGIFALEYFSGNNNDQELINDTNSGQVEAQTAIAKILSAKYSRSLAETHVTITNFKNNFSSGSLYFGPADSAPVEGGVFLARFINNAWIIDYDGNGSIDCVKIRSLGYSQDILSGFCDRIACTAEAKLCPDGSAVGRTGPNCEFAPCPTN
jgi:hypothetical protein